MVVIVEGALRPCGRSAVGSTPGPSRLLGIAGQVQLTGTHALQVGRLAVAIELGDHCGGPEAAALIEQEAEHRMGAERLDVIGGIEVAVITEQHVAFGVDRLQQVTAGAVLGEAELAAHLVLEDLKERAAVVTTGAAIGVDEQPLQQTFLAQVLHVLERLVTFLGCCFHLASSGGLKLEFTAGDLALQLLLLPLGLLQALVLVGVDLGELGELSLDRAQLPLQLVGLAPLGLERIGRLSAGSFDLLAGLIEGLFRVEVIVLEVVVLRLRLGRWLLVGPVLRLRVADELLMLGGRLLQDAEVLEKSFGHRSTHHGCG